MKINDPDLQLPNVKRGSLFMDETETKLSDLSSFKLNGLLEHKEFKETEESLPIALGMTLDSHSYRTDLAALPQLLIVGNRLWKINFSIRLNYLSPVEKTSE